jgi:hypothetical protein
MVTMDPAPDLQTVIDTTLKDSHHVGAAADSAAAQLDFQWPWAIADAGATFLSAHTDAITSLTTGGNALISSPNGASIVAAVASGPTNPANTGQVMSDGIFSNALNGVKADQLLRTVLIGWSSGAQVGLVGGSGGTGVAYDIIDESIQSAVHYGSFNLGIGAHIGVGLVLGAMTEQPAALSYSTCVWSFGASLVGIGVFVSVLMKSSDLSLIGFGLNLGGGAGASSTTGYGSIGPA